MRVGFFGANVGPMASAGAGQLCALAEELGYASMWTGEHMVLPIQRPEQLTIPRDWAFADPLVMLGFLAAHTRSIRLCTGVLLLPQRHPVHLAKELATLDVLCGGRLRVGVGVGYLDAEMDALDVDPARRVSWTSESIEVMQALWAGVPDFSGRHFSYAGVEAYPRPVRPGGPPIVMGGWTGAALRRAARQAEGWYGFGLNPEQVAQARIRLRDEAAAAGRELDRFEIYLTPTVRLTDGLVREFAEVGVDELVVSAEAQDLDGVRRKLTRNCPAALGLTGT